MEVVVGVRRELKTANDGQWTLNYPFFYLRKRAKRRLASEKRGDSIFSYFAVPVHVLLPFLHMQDSFLERLSAHLWRGEARMVESFKCIYIVESSSSVDPPTLPRKFFTMTHTSVTTVSSSSSSLLRRLLRRLLLPQHIFSRAPLCVHCPSRSIEPAPKVANTRHSPLLHTIVAQSRFPSRRRDRCIFCISQPYVTVRKADKRITNGFNRMLLYSSVII